MFRFGLTARLMLAMMLIVTPVTAGILWLMQARVEAAYLRLFEERFLSQIESFSGLQTMRLESIRGRCRELADFDPVIQALQSGSGELPDSILRDLRDKAVVVRESVNSFEDRTALPQPGRGGRSGAPGPEFEWQGPPLMPRMDNPAGRPSGGESGEDDENSSRNRGSRGGRWRGRPYMGRPDFVDLALVSSEGRVYSLKSGPDNNQSLRWLRENGITRVPEEQQTGYLLAQTRHGFKMPREVILTPVRDPRTQRVLGALAVGLPLSTYGENTIYDLNRPGKPGEIYTGIWLEDQFLTRTVPEAERETVEALVRRTVQKESAKDGSESVRLTLAGEPHQMLLRRLNSGLYMPPAWQVTLYSLAGMAAEQRALRNEILAAAALALVAGLALSFLLSRSLMNPVRALVAGTRGIRQGKYDTRVRVARSDELGVLGESFNEMAGGLEQRERYRSVLVQVTDADVARRLMESPTLGGELREVSVLFCDIRGFTAVTDGMAPEGVIAMLNEHMTALTASVHRHHGVVDKFVGDLIMAVFGAPESAGDDAGNAARCALEMVETRRRLNAVTGHPPLEIGLGIASGTAVAGCMGSENRLNYTVLGERVNLASRLCSSAAPGEILIDPATANLLESRAAGELLEEKRFKGFSRPVRPFRLQSLRIRETAPPSPENHGLQPA